MRYSSARPLPLAHYKTRRCHVPISIDADATSLAGGVTTVLDAGSAGSYNFEGFKHDVIDRVDTEVLGLVNLSCIGLVAAHYGELMDARYADPDGVVETIRRFPNQAVGGAFLRTIQLRSARLRLLRTAPTSPTAE